MSKQMKDSPKSENIFHPSSSFSNDKYSQSLQSPDSKSGNYSHLYNNLLNLQNSAGNQAVQKLISSGRLQTKLKVGHSADHREQEADRVADETMKNDKSIEVGFNPQNDYGTSLMLNRMQIGDSSIDNLTDNHSTLINSALSTPGKNLDNNTRDYMEPRLGYNFKNVIIHNDNNASRSADSINAKAYTVGNDIVFGKGQYNPSTDAGKNLIAHELTHVMQQNSNPSNKGLQMKSKLATANKSTGLEGEANKKAGKISADISSKKNKATEEMPLLSEKSFDLQGLKTLKSIPVLAELESNEKKNKQAAVKVNVNFGKIASGQLELRRSNKSFNGDGILTLNKHPLFPDPFPASLVIKISDDKVSGKLQFTTPEEQIFSLLGISPLANKKRIKITKSILE
jgi:hypothetical protein